MKRQTWLLTAAGILTVTVGIAAWMFASGQGWVQASPDRNRSLDRNQISDRNQTPAPVTPARQIRAELEVFAFEDAVKRADLIAKVITFSC